MTEQEREEVFEKLVAEKLAEGGYFEFEGNEDCDEDCAGWDGESRRCECGNRRVCWVLSDDATYVYPEAW